MKAIFEALILVIVLAQSAHAGRLFFSAEPASPAADFALGTTSGLNPSITMTLGDSITVYVWYQRFGVGANPDVIDGLGLDIASSNPVVSRTGFVIDNPLWAGTEPEPDDDEYRWDGIWNGNAPTAMLLVDDSNSIRIDGSFFGKFFDPLRDPVTLTTRFALLTLTGLDVGTTELRLGVGIQGINYVNASNPDDVTNFGWGDLGVEGRSKGSASALADLTVNVVPEPTSLMLFFLGTVALAAMRRRRAF